MKRLMLLVVLSMASINAALAQAVLYGKVTDGKSKEPLIGAIVGFGDTRVATDQYGFYSLHIDTSDEVLVAFTYLGYETKSISVQLSEDKAMNVELNEDTVALPDVIVRSTTIKKEIGRTDISASAMNTTPSLLSEADPIKAFQYLPSIQPANEGQSKSVVRGQAPEATLLILDGINIYNSNHAMGLLSTINAEAVKDMTFYDGYQPASLGGKTGGVLKIQTKDGDLQHCKGNVSIGIVSARANIEAPIVKDKLSFCLAGRRSLIDFFIPLVTKDEEDKSNFYFYDSNMKVTYRPDSRLSISLSGLMSGDKLWSQSNDRYERTHTEQNWKWGTYGGSIIAHYIVSPKWSSRATLAASNYWRQEKILSMKEDETVLPDQTYKNEVSELHANWGNTFYLDNHLSLNTGIGAIYRKATISQADQVGYLEVNASGDMYWTIASWLRAQGGLRVEYPYPVISPRVAISADITPMINTELAYSRTSQRMLTASTNNTILESDIWFTPDSYFLPAVSDQFAITMSGTPLYWLRYSLSGYYIGMSRVVDYKDGFARLDSYRQLPERISVGKGYSYGLEALLETKWHGLQAYISYSYSRVRHISSDINSGEWYRPYYDRPHRLIISANYQFNDRWLASASWHFSSGSVQTVPLEALPISLPYRGEAPHLIEQVTEKNNYRLPDYHRLDIAVSYRLKDWTFALSVYNAYNRQNVYRATIDTEEDGSKSLKGTTLLSIIPGLNIKYSF